MKLSSFLILLTLLLANNNVVHAHEGHDEFVWQVLDTRLPTPLSDMTATLSTQGRGLAYIAGGCDSELGNQFIEFEDAQGINQTGFACFSISSGLLEFDPSTETLKALPDLPRPRYRHGAAISPNQQHLWLFGGRNDVDELIPEVDVYDIEAGVWLPSPGNLPQEFQTSDNAGFVFGDLIYSAGGFEPDYVAKSTVFSMDPSRTSSLVTAEAPSLLEARGDVVAAVTNEAAFVSGGFTHANNYCVPLATVEMFDGGPTWNPAAPLNRARADKALVVLQDNTLYAVGGETQIPNKCIINPDDLPQAGEQTLAVDDVEVLSDSKWNVLASLPEFRFRFPAIGVGDDTIYTFGGQVPYSNECECFQTTNEVVRYQLQPHGSEPPTSGAVIMEYSSKTVIVAAILCVTMGLVL